MTTDAVVHPTTCPMDCPDSCALEVEVRGDEIERIGGRHDHPDTAGFICSKVARFGRRVDHADRLLRPLRRIGPKGSGEFTPIDWEEAIAEIAERLTAVRDEWGGEAILPFNYGGSNGRLSDGLTDDLFFARLGASRLDKTICAVPTSEVATGMYGKMATTAFADFEKARSIVIWGANPRASNIHLVPYLRRARKAGARIAVVDPRRLFGDSDVDLHLPVRPGTDLPVALAMIGEWERSGRLDREFLERHADGLEPLLEAAVEWSFESAAEVAGVKAGEIARLADLYADGEPALMRCGWGVERNRNGGQAVAAILAMPALLGKFGVAGGGYAASNSGAWRFDAEAVVGELDWTTRRLNMTRLGRLLTGELDPPIRALFVYNANPVATVPNQGLIERGLTRDDLFTVVFEQVMTDTCAFADIVLPATTFLEHYDLRSAYGSYYVGGVRPVIAPRGEARSNQEVFGLLGRAMGFADEAFGWSEREIFARAVPSLSVGAGFDAERLAAGRGERPDFSGDRSDRAASGPDSSDRRVDPAVDRPVQFVDVMPRTADGKVHLTPPQLGPAPYRYEAGNGSAGTDGPLALITPSSGRLISSTMGEFHLDRLEVTIHPEDAAERSISAGDGVRVFNDLGEVHCTARIDDAVRPGVLSMPKGAWRKSTGNGSVSTALCPDHVGEVGGGACFNDARVEIRRL